MTADETTIYLDNHATTRVDPAVVAAMLPYFSERYGNAASTGHAFGWEIEEPVRQARREVAEVLGATADEIVFTSGATESINLALKGAIEGCDETRPRIVTVCTEHKATLDTCEWLGARGVDITVLPVAVDGLIDLEALDAAMTDGTVLCSIMAVNNESGVIQPLAEIGELCRRRGVLFHCDAAQAFGKMPLSVGDLGIDLLSLSGHKFYAPKGTGALYCRRQAAAGRKRFACPEQIHGGGHEHGMRSGTLNVPGIVGLGAASRLGRENLLEEEERIGGLRDRVLARLEDELGGIRVNGSMTRRIAGNLSVSFEGIEGEALRIALTGVALSAGSACNSDSIEPSHVLKAMGVSDELANATLRFGVGRFNTEEEIERATDLVIGAVQNLRRVGSRR